MTPKLGDRMKRPLVDETLQPHAPPTVPSLYEWAGGMPALERLTARFYDRIRDDTVLAPVFAAMSAEHPRHVAHFLAEVMRGPAVYNAERGGHVPTVSR